MKTILKNPYIRARLKNPQSYNDAKNEGIRTHVRYNLPRAKFRIQYLPDSLRRHEK